MSIEPFVKYEEPAHPFAERKLVISNKYVVTNLNPEQYAQMMAYVTNLWETFCNSNEVLYAYMKMVSTKVEECYTYAGIPHDVASTCISEEAFEDMLVRVPADQWARILRDCVRLDIGAPIGQLVEEYLAESQKVKTEQVKKALDYHKQMQQKNREYQRIHRSRVKIARDAKGEGKVAEAARQWVAVKAEQKKAADYFKAELEKAEIAYNAAVLLKEQQEQQEQNNACTDA